MAVGAFLGATVAPIDAEGAKFRFPLVKLVRPANVETNVVENRLRDCACGNPVMIGIRSDIRDLAVRGRGSRKPQHITRKLREFVTIRHANPDLHDLKDSCHLYLSFRAISGRLPIDYLLGFRSSRHLKVNACNDEIFSQRTFITQQDVRSKEIAMDIEFSLE
jgi:hypothetical protein